MPRSLLHNRTLLLVISIIHLLMGLSYGHTEMPDDGGTLDAADIYFSSEGAQTACHDEQQDNAKTVYAADCIGQCLSCCVHGPCGLPGVTFALSILPLNSGPIALDPFAKQIHPLIEPRPPRSLRHYA